MKILTYFSTTASEIVEPYIRATKAFFALNGMEDPPHIVCEDPERDILEAKFTGVSIAPVDRETLIGYMRRKNIYFKGQPVFYRNHTSAGWSKGVFLYERTNNGPSRFAVAPWRCLAAFNEGKHVPAKSASQIKPQAFPVQTEQERRLAVADKLVRVVKDYLGSSGSLSTHFSALDDMRSATTAYEEIQEPAKARSANFCSPVEIHPPISRETLDRWFEQVKQAQPFVFEGDATLRSRKSVIVLGPDDSEIRIFQPTYGKGPFQLEPGQRYRVTIAKL